VAEQTLIGFAGLVSPAVAEERGVPRQDKVFVAELSLDTMPGPRPDAADQVRALPRHPSVVRDLSILVSDVLPAEIIRGTIQAAGSAGAASLVAVSFFDRYKGHDGGKGLVTDAGKDLEGKVSLSVHLTFQAPDRTLTDVDVQQSVDRILAALVQAHGAIQR
jgi:phenylalanyl-tRNA synthetase beta chain